MGNLTTEYSHRGFFARYNLIILCAVTFAIPFMWIGAERALLSNKNDVKSWLPDTYEETATFEWYRNHFESDMFILASWEGCTLDSPKLDLLARRLALDIQPLCIAPAICSNRIPHDKPSLSATARYLGEGM